MANYFDGSVPKFPKKCEKTIEKVYGSGWRNAHHVETDGVIGLAICKAILETKRTDIQSVSKYLGLSPDDISVPYERLSKNGYMKESKIIGDEEIRSEQTLAMCYIAGISSGATGLGSKSVITETKVP